MSPQEQVFVIGIFLAFIAAMAVLAIGIALWKRGHIHYKILFHLFVPLGGLCFGIPTVLLYFADSSRTFRLVMVILCVTFSLLWPFIWPYYIAPFLRLMGRDIRHHDKEL